MKKFIAAFVFGTVLLCSPAFAHNDGNRVGVELESTDHVAAGKVQIAFDLIDQQQKTVLKDSDLEVTNEKILHCFIYDAALKEFHHEHPTFDGQMWHVTSNVPVNGNYWVFLQGRIAADHTEFAAGARFTVTGGAPANAGEPVLGDVRSGSDGISIAALSKDKLVAGQSAMLMLSFSRTDGTAPAITPYLGALAHVTIVSSDGDSLVHVHPMSAPGSQLMLHTQFKEAGDYRVWVEFMDGGVLKNVALSVTVH